jgi:hypothetical protein
MYIPVTSIVKYNSLVVSIHYRNYHVLKSNLSIHIPPQSACIIENFDPLPAINHWFSLRSRHPRQNDKAKEQEWFLGVFDEAENRSISLPSQPVVGPTCEAQCELQVQMTENKDDDELSALNDDVVF